MNLKKLIRDIPDFPEKNIIFRDVAPVFQNKEALQYVVRKMVLKYKNQNIDKVVGIDARGFILAGILAEKLKAGMVMVRKKGKLPFETESIEYDLEYGKSILEIHKDSIKKGEKLLLVDDVLATGGTMSAAIQLVEKLGGKVSGIAFLIVLNYLPGRERLKNYPLFSLVKY